MNRSNVLWFIAGGIFAAILLSHTRVIEPQPSPPVIRIESPEPPLFQSDEQDMEGMTERERFLFKRFSGVADKRAERILEARGPGIVATAIGNTIDEATAAAEGKKTVSGVWSALGMKLFQFVRTVIRAVYIWATTDVIWTYWYIFWPLVAAIVSVIFWMNGWIGSWFKKT